ncbi:MAG: acyl-CoA dehydrogenase family protein, partial [Actinomycetota bacterium]|nr:acyl-CoA dehydrogenase family protein [Actinomycetota bacterium]
EQIIDAARANGRSNDPAVRQGLARAWSKVKIMEINGFRSLTDSLNGTHHMAAWGALNKMNWSEFHKETMNLAIDILGMDGQVLTGDPVEAGSAEPNRRGRADYPVSDIQASFFFSRSETIWGGTAEIQRNIVGERVLGLPKEPKPASAAS